MSRPYEIAVLGATGFTGKLVCAWLAEQVPDLRWALAGRNLHKLEAVRQELLASHPHLEGLPLVHADTTDPDSLAALARQTSVLLTTTGPYIKYGPPVVDACVDAGTDYVDITGEPSFVAETIRRHDEAARAKGLRIVHCCGYDSIPHDLGAYFTVQQLPRQGRIELLEYARLSGKMSGGTWNSALEHMGSMGATDLTGLIDRSADRTARGLKGPQIRRAPKSGWAVASPTIDPLIVLRSANALGYGPEFRFGQYLCFRRLGQIVALGAGAGVTSIGAKFGPVRRYLQRRLPPGSGPTPEQMQRGWMTIDFVGREGDQEVQTQVRTEIDAGYAFTARMISSAALCLVRDRDQLPDRCGVMTPAVAMAEPLLTRLQAAGMHFEVR